MADQSDLSRRVKVCISRPGQTKQVSSVIQVSRAVAGTEFLKISQLPTIESEGEYLGATTDEPDSYQRRELLARRPSYRKLLDDLTGDPHSYVNGKVEDNSSDGHLTQDSNDNSNDAATAIDQGFYFGSQDDGSNSGIQTLRVGGVTSPSVSASGAVIQCTQGPDGGQYFIPVQQLSASGVVSFPQGIMVSAGGVGINTVEQLMEEASRKREMRLLKNKEAAKECRRKKKEYVRCLENRVAVLENQNRTLIDELKSLKELYCQKDVHS